MIGYPTAREVYRDIKVNEKSFTGLGKGETTMNIDNYVFDYDQTLVDSNGVIMPLLVLLIEMGVKTIRIWSAGGTWNIDGILEAFGITAVHVDTTAAWNKISTEAWNMELHAVEHKDKQIDPLRVNAGVPGYKKIEYVDDHSILIDDLADRWSAVSNPARNILPEQAVEIFMALRNKVDWSE